MKSYLIPSTIVFVIASCSTPATAELNSEYAKSEFKKYISQGRKDGVYWPTKGWRTAKPEEVGMNSSKLVKAIEYAASPQYKTDGVAIIKSGYIVAEACFGTFQKDTKHISHSVAKSFTSALVGIAIPRKTLLRSIQLCLVDKVWSFREIPGDIRVILPNLYLLSQASVQFRSSLMHGTKVLAVTPESFQVNRGVNASVAGLLYSRVYVFSKNETK